MLLNFIKVDFRTKVLVEKYTELISAGVKPSEILVLVQNSTLKKQFVDKIFEKLNVHSFFSIVYNTLIENWCFIENAIPSDKHFILPNLVGLEVTEDESEVKTRIICYGKNGSATLESPHLGDYIYPKIYTLEDENKTLSEVQAEAQKLLDEGCDIPSINIKVDFVALEKTVEYRDYAVLEEVFLGDMVTVINTKMDFQKQAKVISYEWDCLLEQYNDVELGDFIPTLAASVTSGVKSGSLASSAYINAASVMTLLQQHLNDFENPHHVTAAQVQG